MPSAALRPCTYPGCSALVSRGRCPRHTQDYTRPPEVSRLYNSARWRALRVRQLAAHPWCAICLVAQRYTPATDVDHIERHGGDPVKFFAGPFQSLCAACHSRKTSLEVGFAGSHDG